MLVDRFLDSLEAFGPPWATFFGFLCTVHLACYCCVRLAGSDELRSQPSLAAHVLPQLLGFAVLAHLGVTGWWISPAPPGTDPIGGYFFGGDRISAAMVGFQLYELVACAPCPRLRGLKGEMVFHHCVTLLLAVLAHFTPAYHFFCPMYDRGHY
jgi:hypothetical protein